MNNAIYQFRENETKIKNLKRVVRVWYVNSRFLKHMLNKFKFVNNVQQFVISIVKFDFRIFLLKMINVQIFNNDVFVEVVYARVIDASIF